MEDLVAKTAVITGAASGIGLAMAHRFADEGMQLMLADVEAEPLASAVAELDAKGAVVDSFEIDVRDLGQVRELRSWTQRRFGDTHLLCNNAGVGAGGPVSGLDDVERWKWTIDVNLWGVIYGCKVFLPAMVEHGEQAHIVNTASMAGHIAPANMGAYNVSKFGVVALSETLSREMQTTNTQVGVSVLCPAFVRTGINDSQRNMPAELHEEPTEEGLAMKAVVDAMVAAGMETEAVADAVTSAVKDNRFWILTHDETKAAITARAQDIVNGVNPKPGFG